MSFPIRPSRSSFGPDPVNTRPVRDPSRELDGEKVGRLMFHQLAGLGVVSPLAWLLSDGATTTPALLAHAEAWNPNGLLTTPYDPPVITYDGTGLFTIDFNAQYPDHTGALQTLALSFGAGHPTVRSGSPQEVIAEVTAANQVQIEVFDGGALADVPWALLVW